MSNLPFGFEQPQDSPGFLLWQTTMLWQRQIKKALEPYQLSHAQFVIMAALMWLEVHHCDITQILIVNHTKLDKMTVSKSLKGLVEQGYVKRNEHQKDTRAKATTLTPKGNEVARKLIHLIEKIDAQFFGQTHRDEQRKLIKILAKLVKNNDG